MSLVRDHKPSWILIAPFLILGCVVPELRVMEDDKDGKVAADAGGSDADAGGSGADATPGTVSFALDIRPLMNRPSKGDPTGKGCKGCHYRTEPSSVGLGLSGLDLTTLGSLRRGGGSSGQRIIVPSKPRESVLVQVLNGVYPIASRMPKNGPYWSEQEVALLELWISEGAIGSDDE